MRENPQMNFKNPPVLEGRRAIESGTSQIHATSIRFRGI